jgi:hypothetical protein
MRRDAQAARLGEIHARRVPHREPRAPDRAAGSRTGAPVSAGEQQILGRIGADRIDPGIREQIDRETQSLAEADRTFVDRLLFWRATDPNAGSQLDAAREAQRLREVSASGRPVNEGEVPTIRKRQRGIFEGIF